MQVRAGKAAAKREAAEREWRVHQVAGELARQADLLEKHRHRVAQEASDHPQAQPTQVSLSTHCKAGILSLMWGPHTCIKERLGAKQAI